jgi:phosphotriesterase-related protein
MGRASLVFAGKVKAVAPLPHFKRKETGSLYLNCHTITFSFLILEILDYHLCRGTMNRRLFLQCLLLGSAANVSANLTAASRSKIYSVLGPLSPDKLGITLIHEHLLVDFGGAAVASEKRYDPEEAFRVALPHLKRIRNLGCQTFVDCTPAYLGRNPLLLRRLAQASGLNILTNTGYYGAADDKGIPPHAYSESAEQLARRWTQEYSKGIEGTGIKPAFIKTGVDSAPLSEIDAKLVQAAALTHLATGLKIAAHTTTGKAARQELEILRKYKVRSSAWIWVHAQAEPEVSAILEIARQGAWISLDGVGEKSFDLHLNLVKALRGEGHLSQLLLSQDSGWYHVGEPGGGEFRPFDWLFTEFVPALRKEGLPEPEIRQLLIDNPRRVLTPAIQRA